MDAQLLRDAVEGLKRLRTEVQGTVEKRVIDELDKAITQLEEAQNSPSISIDPADVLMLLAKALESLPEIVEALRNLIGSD